MASDGQPPMEGDSGRQPLQRATLVFAAVAAIATLTAVLVAVAGASIGLRSGAWPTILGATAGCIAAIGAFYEAVHRAGHAFGVWALGVGLLALSAAAAILFLINQGRPLISLGSAVVAAGDLVTVVGENFDPGSTVDIWLGDSTKLGERTVLADGSFSFEAQIPEDAGPGVIRAIAAGDVAEAAIEVHAQRRILFWSNLDDDYDIYALDPAGGAPPEPVMDKGTDDRYPSWSPDGARIAFARDEGSNWNIWIMNADGTEPRQLTADIAHERFPVWSPSGDEILFARGDGASSDLYIADASSGQKVRQLTSMAGEERTGSWVGETIAFWFRALDGGDLYTIRPDRTELTPLDAINTPQVERSPSWSPNGRQLAFTSDRAGQRDIWLYDLESGELQRLTQDRHDENTPTWSPDGLRIAFIRGEQDAINIWTMNASGGNEIGLTVDLEELHYLDPSWGP